MENCAEQSKKTTNLTLGDAASIFACWSGIIALLYLGQTSFDFDPILSVIGLAVGYHLSKFIIFKKQ